MENQDQDNDQNISAPVAPSMPQEKPVNLVNPRGDIVSVPQSQVDQALGTGYQQASPDQVDKYFKEQKYGSLGQQAIAGLEGAASAGTFGLSTGVETALGVDPEDIRGREETNPITHGVGEGAGLVASSLLLPGGGAQGLITKAGEGAAEVLGLGAETANLASKVGSTAVKNAVEFALVSSSNEVSKMLASDPNQSVETALTDIGLSGLMGAGLGAVGGTAGQIWDKTVGPKLQSFLETVTNRLNQGSESEAGQFANSGRGEVGGGTGAQENPGKVQSESAPLEGLPKSSPGPIQTIRDSAKEYSEEAGLDYQQPNEFVKADKDRGKRIADAYEAMEHDPNNPDVKKSYKALIDETLDQYQTVKKSGLKIDVIKPGMENPYPDGPQSVLNDIRNGHLWLFPTDSGFGSLSNELNHPLLAPTDEVIGDHQLVANDVFRIVHDFFGHAKEGAGFGPHGEENAWQSHVRMYSPDAIPAMTTETRGQNSWVNYGPHGESNQINKAGTVYADQKAGLLPDWVSKEGLATNRQFKQPPAIKSTGTSALINPDAMMDEAGAQTRASLLKNGAPDEFIQNAIAQSGMKNIPDELQTAMGQDPMRRFDAQILRESPSKSGIYYKKALSDFYDNAGNNIMEALGKTPQEAQALAEMSENKVGQTMMDQMESSLRDKFAPVSDAYDQWFNKAAKVDISPTIASQVSDNLGLLNISSGASKLPGSSRAELMNWAMKTLPLQETLEDLSKFKSEIFGKIKANPDELGFLKGDFNQILTDAEDNLISHGVKSGMVSGSLDEYRNIKAQYGPIRELLNDLGDRLSLKKWRGVNTFIDSMQSLTPEKFLKQMSVGNDADFLTKVMPNFPEAAETLKDYHLNDLIKDSVLKSKKNEDFNLNGLFKDIGQMSPEMKQFVLPEGSINRISATRYLMDSLPEKLNNSGTATTLLALMKKHLPASAIGFASLLGGAGVGASFAVGAVADMVAKEAPDAARLGFLKFLGSSNPIEAGAFKNMVESIVSTIKGENLVSKASSAIFKAGSEVLPQSLIPTEEKRKKLDKMLQTYQTQPQKLLNIANDGSSYLPEQNEARGATAMRAVNLLNSMRPNPTKRTPLDTEGTVNPIQKASYDRALDLAEQPLMILKHLNEGTLNVGDVGLVKNLYPNLYARLNDKITNEMVDHISKGNTIPYQTQLGISKLMAQPMVSSASPDSIMQIQSSFTTQPKSQQQGGPQQGGKKGSLKNIKDIATLEGSTIQNRNLTRWD